jgi:hypothetical protein
MAYSKAKLKSSGDKASQHFINNSFIYINLYVAMLDANKQQDSQTEAADVRLLRAVVGFR